MSTCLIPPELAAIAKELNLHAWQEFGHLIPSASSQRGIGMGVILAQPPPSSGLLPSLRPLGGG
eukprot:4692314-Karenia_brevis.AAC.1